MPGAYLAWVESGVALAILFAASWILFRHIGFALLAVLSPLVPFLFTASIAAAPYLCGFIVSAILIAGVEVQRSHGTASSFASAAREFGAATIWPAVIAAALMAVAPLFSGQWHGLSQSGLILACCASAIVLDFAIARFLPFGEQSIIQANRLREARDRWLDALAFVVQLRWSWSITGIALIFAVMGYFGGANAGTAFPLSYRIVNGWMVACLFLGYAASRDRRRTIAFVLTMLPIVCLSYWATARLNASLTTWNEAIALGAIPVATALASAASFARAGDSIAVASLRAMEQNAFALIIALTGATIASVLLSQWMLVCVLPFSAAAALIVFPALTAAIYDLFPPRVSLDAYKQR